MSTFLSILPIIIALVLYFTGNFLAIEMSSSR